VAVFFLLLLVAVQAQSRFPVLPDKTPRPTAIPASVFRQPAELQKAIRLYQSTKSGSTQRLPENISNDASVSASFTAADSLCEDNSVNKLIGLKNGLIYPYTIRHTRDDAVLIAGSMQDTAIGDNYFYGFIMKVDKNGQVMWNRIFDNGNNDRFHVVFFFTRLRSWLPATSLLRAT